ncbi:MAG: hypothetical protein WCP31_07510 [Chloroflexales bacterium]
MKFFLFFLVTCLALGMFTPQVSLSRLTWVLVGLSLTMMIGYYFFRMI